MMLCATSKDAAKEKEMDLNPSCNKKNYQQQQRPEPNATWGKLYLSRLDLKPKTALLLERLDPYPLVVGA